MDRFDELSRVLARSTPRRGALKILGAAVGGAVAATVLKPFRADAACAAGETVCGPNCCPSGVACLNPSTGQCGCPAGQTRCGTACCSGTCSDPSRNCCCPSGLTPCGPACCAKGVACIDPAVGFCGCPPKTTPCHNNESVLTCCPKGTACGPNSGDCPQPDAPPFSCCGGFQSPCNVNGDCCSGVCSPAKGNRCGCATDADCPSEAPVCNTNQGTCSA